jgi:glycosyltransferase involved in cell wall biosynthesis
MVEGQAKWELYSQSDVFVLPTYQENFGLVLVEAMMSGVPTITTKGTDIWPELESANAFIVDQTPEAIADAIQQVCLSSAADKYVPDVGKLKNWLEPSALRESYAKMYRSLIDP